MSEFPESEMPITDATEADIRKWVEQGEFTRPLYGLPPATTGTVQVPAEVVRFLNGEGRLLGVYFGDDHPNYQGKFWWRKFLPAAPLSPAPKVKK